MISAFSTYQVPYSWVKLGHFRPEPVPLLSKPGVIRGSERKPIDAPHRYNLLCINVLHPTFRTYQWDNRPFLVVKHLFDQLEASFETEMFNHVPSKLSTLQFSF